MTAKTYPNASMAPDGSSYVTLTDGVGNLVNTAANAITIGTSPITGGATTQVLFNLAGKVSSDSGFTYAGAGGTVTVAGLTNSTTRNDTGYGYFQPTTGQTVTLSNTAYHTIIDPAGTLASLTVNMPATPTDGMIVDIRFSQVITALTVSGNGHSILGNPTTAALGATLTAIYKVSNTTWYM